MASIREVFTLFRTHGRQDFHVSTQGQPTFPGLDSDLIRSIFTVGQAIDRIRQEDISDTTKRELVDRTVRAVGKATLEGNVPYAVFATVEETARTFYCDFYTGTTPRTVSLPRHVVCDIAPIGIENANRNLAAPDWEERIRSCVNEEVQAFQAQAQGREPVVVSVAFGGNEPALLLSGMLGAPIVHVKPVERTRNHWDAAFLGKDPSVINGRFCFIVDDRVISGRTLQAVRDVIDANFAPSKKRIVVVA